MAEQMAQRFIDALGKLESGRDVEPLVALFSDKAEIGNVLEPEPFHGTDGARRFWTIYRDTFGEIRSTFRNTISGDGTAALEWTSEGTGADGGRPFRYDGVSVIETDGDQIRRFWAYFDPRSLGRQLEADESQRGATGI